MLKVVTIRAITVTVNEIITIIIIKNLKIYKNIISLQNFP